MSAKSTYMNTKCCVYYAELPNYLLGGLLQDSRDSLKEGQDIARKLIEAKVGISPYGIRKPVWYKKFEKEKKKRSDVNSMTQEEKEKLRCPFYGKDGNCTTWAYREHCCSTHFCFSVGGKSGTEFWNKFDKFLHKSEAVLAQYAATKLGCSVALNKENLADESLNADDNNRVINEKKYSQIWSSWAGKEEEFYIASYEVIKSLTKAEYLSIIDEEIETTIPEFKDLISQFKENIIPNNLKWNNETQIELMPNNLVKVSTSIGSHELEMTKLPILQAFDGSKELIKMVHLAFKVDSYFTKDIFKLMEIKALEVA